MDIIAARRTGATIVVALIRWALVPAAPSVNLFSIPSCLLFPVLPPLYEHIPYGYTLRAALTGWLFFGGRLSGRALAFPGAVWYAERGRRYPGAGKHHLTPRRLLDAIWLAFRERMTKTKEQRRLRGVLYLQVLCVSDRGLIRLLLTLFIAEPR